MMFFSAKGGMKQAASIVFSGTSTFTYNGFAPTLNTAINFIFPDNPDFSTLAYSYVGTGTTNYPASATAPTKVGTYTIVATMTFATSGFVSSNIFPFTIIKATPTLSVTNPTLTYTANAQSATVSSSVAGNFPTALKYNGSTTMPTNAGTYTITADFIPNDVSNYNSLTGEIAGNFTINKAPVTISNIVLTKVYDGTPNILLIDKEEAGIISGDNVVITGNATSFSNKIVANNYSSTITFSLTTIPSTGKENNYYISGSNPISITNGSITKLPITLTANTNTKVYDGTVSATVTPTITAGALVSGDVGTYSETYDTKSQGINKILTPTVVSILDAANTSMAGNYSITYATNTNGIITKLPITITASANTKVYDGTVSATATPTLTGSLASGDIGTYSETYDTKTQGINKTITPTGTILDATNATVIGNYSITYATNTNGVITKLPITITASANTKVYDGTISATATPTITTGALVSGDVGTYSETYDTKTQGINKTITPTATILDATSASVIGNYSITYAINTNGLITKLPITLTASANTKVYDGTISATATPTITTGALVSGDVGTYSETYDTKTQGINKTITPTATILDATSASVIGNYSITYATNTNGVITKLPITLTATVNTKVYDGTISATATPILTGILASGDVGVYSETYDTKSQGTNKTLTPTGTILDPTNATMTGNYSITYASINTGSITKLPITITASTNTKVYDGTISATATPTLTGTLVSGDVGTYSETYDTKTQGINKTITPTATILDASNTSMIGNYSITYTIINTGEITSKQLTIVDPTITKSKEYDKTLTANTTAGTLSGVVTVGLITDAVTASAVGTYSTSSVGTSKTITVVYTLAGVDKDNYIKPVDKVYTDGVITAKQLTIADPTITKSKEYDKTLTANTTAGTLSGVVTVGLITDAVTASAVGTYSTSSVGTTKTITVVYTLDGADKDNYIKPVDKVYIDGVITAKQLTVTGITTANKQYDRTNTASVSGGTLVGVISPDLVNLTQSGTFAQVNVGTGIAITSTSTIDNTNYSLTQPTLTARDITPKVLTVTATPGQTKVFGAADPPNFTYSLSAPLLGSDVLTGALKRDAGEAIGLYAINQGTLTNLNYNITFVGNNFVITPAPVNNTGTTKAYDLPNAFTPNGDGKNDEFKIIVNDPSRVTLVSFQIYNRNGILMFSTNKISEGWDGRYKGVMQDMGIYFVKLITSENGLETTPPIYLLK